MSVTNHECILEGVIPRSFVIIRYSQTKEMLQKQAVKSYLSGSNVARKAPLQRNLSDTWKEYKRSLKG